MNNPEIGSQFCGGGLSHYFERPEYQNSAVDAFLWTLGSRYTGLYKCVRSRDLSQPILTMSFAQP
jgi:hypothetical protein